MPKPLLYLIAFCLMAGSAWSQDDDQAIPDPELQTIIDYMASHPRSGNAIPVNFSKAIPGNETTAEVWRPETGMIVRYSVDDIIFAYGFQNFYFSADNAPDEFTQLPADNPIHLPSWLEELLLEKDMDPE